MSAGEKYPERADNGCMIHRTRPDPRPEPRPIPVDGGGADPQPETRIPSQQRPKRSKRPKDSQDGLPAYRVRHQQR